MTLDRPTDWRDLRYAANDDDRYRRLVGLLDDWAVILLDDSGHVVSWNRGAERIKGYSFAEVVGQSVSLFYTPEAVAVGHPEAELSVARATGRYEEEGWRVRKGGARFWASVSITSMRRPDGSLEGYGKVVRDLTATMQIEQQAANTLALLRTTVETDSLTGTLNRPALDVALTAALSAARPFCVAMLDLDQFKEVNDRLGHAEGDRVLRETTRAWREALRDGDLLARYGGEEFTLILQSCDLYEGVAVAERVRIATPIGCTCSVGVAQWSPGMTQDQVLSGADAALYDAKDAGRDCVRPDQMPGPARIVEPTSEGYPRIAALWV